MLLLRKHTDSHFVDITETYRFCLNLCTKHTPNSHSYGDLSHYIELYREKSGPLSDEIWKRCLKTCGFFPQQPTNLVYKPCLHNILRHAGYCNTASWNTETLCTENGKWLSHIGLLLGTDVFLISLFFLYFH